MRVEKPAYAAISAVEQPSPARLPTGHKGQRVKDICTGLSFRKPLKVPLLARPASDACTRRYGWCPLSPAPRRPVLASACYVCSLCIHFHTMNYVWDETKRKENLHKHGVDFADAVARWRIRPP